MNLNKILKTYKSKTSKDKNSLFNEEDELYLEIQERLKGIEERSEKREVDKKNAQDKTEPSQPITPKKENHTQKTRDSKEDLNPESIKDAQKDVQKEAKADIKNIDIQDQATPKEESLPTKKEQEEAFQSFFKEESASSNFKARKMILNRDKPAKEGFLWLPLSIIFLISVVIFYFGGIQTLALNAYTLQARANVKDMYDDYLDRSENILKLKTDIEIRGSYNPTISCSKEQSYQEYQQDTQKIKNLKTALRPKDNLQSLDNYTVFYDQKTKDIYEQIFSTYQKSLLSLQNQTETLKQTIEFLNYRNQWIASCESINQEISLEVFDRECAKITSSTEKYKQKQQDKLSQIYSLASQEIDKGLQICQDLKEDTDLDRWLVDWNNQYSEILAYSFSSQEINQLIAESLQKLSQQTNSGVRQIDNRYNQKIQFKNWWYILDFN